MNAMAITICLMLATTSGWAQPARPTPVSTHAPRPELRVTVHLTDGSQLIGRLNIPFVHITRLHVRAADGARRLLTPDDWEALPFPVTCDWPGPQGTVSRIEPDGIRLLGSPVRTRGTWSLPLVFECEFEFVKAFPRSGGINFRFFPAGAGRDAEPDDALMLYLECEPDGPSLRAVPSLLQHMGTKYNEVRHWRGATQLRQLGRPNHLRLTVEKNRVQITLNEETQTVEGFTADYRDVQVQIWHWQPTTRWVVRNTSIC